MKEELKDFNKEAADWDANPDRVKLAYDVADAIIREVAPTRDLTALDFGCGTGLVTLKLQPLVKTIVGVDSSEGMIAVLRDKIEHQRLNNIRTQIADFQKGEHIDGTYNLVVSSMTLHHVPDTAALFRQWYTMLLPGGKVCFADLDAEDGTFHGDNKGVFHFGFDRELLKQLLRETGFYDIHDVNAAHVTRIAQGGGKRRFPVFLITGRK